MTPPLPLEEAQRRLVALAPELPVEHRAVAECSGFYLAAPLRARRTQPAGAMSAMDGYALAEGDLAGPWRVIGESAAGRPFAGTVAPGEAVRISTGALLPQGASAVLVQEDCAHDSMRLRLTGDPPSPGRHVRPAGLDFQAGAELLLAGARLSPAQIGLASAGGHGALPVRRAVRLAIIDSGDELVPAGAPCPPHRLPASNGPMLAAMAAALPCEVSRHGPISDRRDALEAAFDAAAGADVVVTSGGASVGEHDLIRPALEALGASLEFWRVAIKPGKPLLVARRGPQVVVGLPGNPASAFVTAFLFLLPLLRATLGAADPLPRTIPARLGGSLGRGGGRTEFLRGRWDGTEVVLETEQDSSALLPLARSNALVRREIGAAAVNSGATVPMYWLENGGMA